MRKEAASTLAGLIRVAATNSWPGWSSTPRCRRCGWTPPEALTDFDAAPAATGEAVDRGEPDVDEEQRVHAAVTAAAHSTLPADCMAEISLSIAESRTESLRPPDRPARSLPPYTSTSPPPDTSNCSTGGPSRAIEPTGCRCTDPE